MMVFLFALALAQAAPFDTKANYVDLAKQYCAKTWPNDFEMERYCLSRQATGMVQFKTVSDELGKPIEKALETCTEKWTSDRLPNWEMIGYCATKQAEAFREIHPSSP